MKINKDHANYIEFYREKDDDDRPQNQRPSPRKPRDGGDDDDNKKRQTGWQVFRQITFWLLIFVVAIVLSQVMQARKENRSELDYSTFLVQLEQDNIRKVTFIAKRLEGELKSPIEIQQSSDFPSQKIKNFETQLPFDDPDLVTQLHEKNVIIDAKTESLNWTNLLLGFLPWIILIGFFIFLMRQLQGGNKAFTFGKSKAKLFTTDHPKVTFKDVAGAEEAKEELVEIIEFLREPEKFTRLGGKIPKGALLLGPPGTGKTLLAKAVAGEADVPFFSMSGSDFVEMFVGVGASRVRDLFEQGKKNAPCIIFIDEIDAVGRHRGAGLGGGHDEREQTLNQLLVEMDGFGTNEGVILIAATNRPDVLDPALLRPGRFDRQIVVDRPDVAGREGILRVHSRNIPLAKNVKLDILAKVTPGFSGADLANLVNEAALLAARNNRKKVNMADFENAKDKVIMGAERRSLIISDDEKRVTAYHEAGHVLVAKLIPHADPVHKVTIIPRGRALGVTSYLPIDERHNLSKEYLEALMAKAMGGRAAEEVVFGQITSGAYDDIKRATDIARKMVSELGMSEKIGPLNFGTGEEQIFLGREFSQHRYFSEQTAQEIDAEVRKLVESAHHLAVTLMRKHKDKLAELAEALLEKEILDNNEIDQILGEDFLEEFCYDPHHDGGRHPELPTEEKAEDLPESPEKSAEPTDEEPAAEAESPTDSEDNDDASEEDKKDGA